ncbi:MAG: anaerobic ribonucleoside-triphosphate reductase activating protein [Rhodospirillales bacterium]|nr:anaerobic ribonucleoside-triphosphate reductase activating protein [Rhodospirillales bacterium]
MSGSALSKTTRSAARTSDLRIGGLTRLSSCDWPGRLAATVFLIGCPWRCRYCHNARLLAANCPEALDWDDVLAFLARRRGLLDGVVFSGGEPTFQAALPAAMAAVRDRGFAVGLHTSGGCPQTLDAVLPLTNWVGFDVKAPFGEYAPITGIRASGRVARKSLEKLIGSGCPYEVRTTVHPDLLDGEPLENLARDLARMGVRHYALQAFRPEGCMDAALNASAPATDPPLLSDTARALFDEFTVRPA